MKTLNTSLKKSSRTAKCLLCREKNFTRKMLPEDSDTFRTSTEMEMVKRIEKSWAKNCIDSLCSILHITKTHPFRHFFLNANYCQDCRQLLRDIDFSLTTLKTLQQQIVGFRNDVLNNLGDNYNAIENKERIVINHKDIERPKSKTKNVFQYDEVIKILFEKINGEQENWTSVDFLEQKHKSDTIFTISSVSCKSLRKEIKKDDTKSADAEIAGDHQINNVPIGLRQRNLKRVNYTEDIDDKDSRLDIMHEKQCSIKGQARLARLHEDKDPDWSDWNMSDAEPVDDDVINQDNQPYLKTGKTTVVRITEENQPYHCKNKISAPCHTGFCDEKALRVHQRIVHEDDPKPYHCELCDMKYRFSVSLSAHMVKHRTPPVRIQCSECDKTFTQTGSRNFHMATKHNKESNQSNPCSFCGKEFDKEELLLDHENLHKNSNNPFQCVTCNENFSNSVKLKKHTRTHEGKAHVCEFCGKTFRTPGSLRTHKKIHDESYVGHKCPQCDLTFSTKHNLDGHMNTHSTEKSFICDVCGLGFRWKKGLVVHYRKHTGETPFSCKVCGKRFTAVHFLHNHEETHAGILAYECKHCNKRFRTRNNLKQHEKTHEPKDPNRKPRIRTNKKRIKQQSKTSETGFGTRDTESRQKSVSEARANCLAKRKINKNFETSDDSESDTTSSIESRQSSVDLDIEESVNQYSNPSGENERLLQNTASEQGLSQFSQSQTNAYTRDY